MNGKQNWNNQKNKESYTPQRRYRYGRRKTEKEAAEKYVKQNITMEPEQLKRLMLYCQKEDRSMSWVIRKALEMYLEKVA